MTDLIEFYAQTDIAKPIPPIQDVGGWQDVPIQDNGEELVPLGAFSAHSRILTSSIYYGEMHNSPYEIGQLKDALLSVFVRESVAQKLLEADALLPRGYAFLAWDGYRPLNVQNTLYTEYVDKLMAEQGMNQEDAEQAALTYVNRASDHPDHPSIHHTGGSIDLTIIRFDDAVVDEVERIHDAITKLRRDMAKVAGDAQAVDALEDVEYPLEMRRLQLLREHSQPIDVGAQFDETNEISAVRHFEERLEAGEDLNELEMQQAMNRRIFQNILRSVGFTSFASEWWHVDLNTQFYAVQKNVPAQYGPIKLGPTQLAHEAMRVGHYNGTKILHHGGRAAQMRLAASRAKESDKALAVEGAKCGDMVTITHPEALRL